MIDLHCHILPALDDGARDIADSIAMARQAEDDRIEIVCATPHIRSDHRVEIGELQERVDELQRELGRAGVRVRIARGGEVAQARVAELGDERLREVSLNGRGWVLIEPGPGPLGPELVALTEELSARGHRAIVAHPERHAGPSFERQLRELADRGALIQWTAEFIATSEPDGPVLALARAGLVHLLGSDAHSSHAGRPVRLAAGFTRLEAACGGAWARWIAEEAPRAVLGGRDPVSPPPAA